MKTEQAKDLHELLWGYLESNNYLELPAFLAQNSCDLNQPNSKQENLTPLQYAVKTRRVELVKILLDKGADLLKQDKNGNYPFDYACMDFPDEIDVKASPRNKNIKQIEEIISLIFKKHIQAGIPIPYDFHHKHSISVKPKKPEYDATRIFDQNSKEIILRKEWFDLLATSPHHDHIFWLGAVHHSGIFIKKDELLKEWNALIAFEYFEKYIEKIFKDEKNFEDKNIISRFKKLKDFIFGFIEENGERYSTSPIDDKLQEKKFLSWKTYEKLNWAPLWLKLAANYTMDIEIPVNINFPYDCFLAAIEAVVPSTEPLYADSNNKLATLSDLDKNALEEGFTACFNYLTVNRDISNLNDKTLELIMLFKRKRDFASEKTQRDLVKFLTEISSTSDELYDYIEKLAGNDKNIFFSLLMQIPEDYSLQSYVICKFVTTHKQIDRVDGPLGLMIYLGKTLQLPSDSSEAYSVTSEQIGKAKEFSKKELHNYLQNSNPEISKRAREISDAIAKAENTEEQVKTTATSGALPTHLEPKLYPNLNTNDSLEDQKQLWNLVKQNDANALMAFFGKKPRIDINQSNPEEKNLTPLQYAASQGLLASTDALLINKADVNLGDPSPLHLAVKNRHPEIVDSLLDEEKIDLYKTDKHGYVAIDWVNGYFPSDLEGIMKENKNQNKIQTIGRAILKKHIKANIPITYELNEQSIPSEKFTRNEKKFIDGFNNIFDSSDNYQHFLWLANLYAVRHDTLDVASTFRYRYLKKAVELLIKKANKLKCQEPFWSEEFLKNFRLIKNILFIFRHYYSNDTYGSPIDEPLSKIIDIDWGACESLNYPPFWIKLAKQTKFPDRIPKNINFPYECYLKAILACELLPCENTSDKKLAMSSADKTALETAIKEYIEYLKTLKTDPKLREETLKLAKVLFNKGALLGDSKQPAIDFLLTLAEEFKDLYFYIASLYIPNKDDFIQRFDKKNFQNYFQKIPQDFPLTSYLETLYSIATGIDKNSGKLALIPRFGKILQIIPPTSDSNSYLIDEEQIREAKSFAIANLDLYAKDQVEIIAKEAKKLLNKSTSPSAPPMDKEILTEPTSDSVPQNKSQNDVTVSTITIEDLKKELDAMSKDEKNNQSEQQPEVNSKIISSIQNPEEPPELKMQSAVTSPTATQPGLFPPTKSMPEPSSSTGIPPKQEEEKVNQNEVKLEEGSKIKFSESTNFWQSKQLKKSKIALSKELKEEEQSIACEEEELLNRLRKLEIKKEAFEEKVKQFKISENTKIFEGLKINPQEQLKKQFKEEKTQRREKLTDEKLDKSYKYELTIIKKY